MNSYKSSLGWEVSMNDNPSFDSIGRYLFNDKKKKMNGEFDLVSEREGKLVDYECKYRNEPVTLSDYEEELEQSQKLLIPFQKIEFISRNGFAPSFPQQ